jgi:hypothetical protein
LLPVAAKSSTVERVVARLPRTAPPAASASTAAGQHSKREREAHARGDQHRRYTYNDVTEDPAQMLTELRALLAPD